MAQREKTSAFRTVIALETHHARQAIHYSPFSIGGRLFYFCFCGRPQWYDGKGDFNPYVCDGCTPAENDQRK